MLSKIISVLRQIPVSFLLVAGLVVFVVFFANPVTLIKSMYARLTEETITGNESVILSDIKKMGKMKVLKRYVGGFLDLPADLPENKEDRDNFRVVYQWEGSAEFILDLTQIRKSDCEGGIVLEMPPITIENLREVPLSGTRCVIKKGGKGADAILGSISQIVAKRLRRDVDTPENYQKARTQAEYLLSSMCRVLKPDLNIAFRWN